jgi:capsular exopolysaccharide synthesis family protein
MPDEYLIRPPAPAANESTQLGPVEEEFAAPAYEGPFYTPFEPTEEAPPLAAFDLRRALYAVLRYKWLLIGALVVGLAGAYYAWTSTPVTYTAEGNLWIETAGGDDRDVTPIEAGGLLDGNAWIELLRSYQVLDTVVMREKLYVSVSSQFRPAFQRFDLAGDFLPGDYVLKVGRAGDDFVLTTAEGALVQQAMFGTPIGENVGFRWNPARGSFPANAEIRFSVHSIRDAAVDLSGRINTGMDIRTGNFLSVALSGANPERIASILNAVMERHVDIAAELKRNILDETLVILEEQLQLMEAELAQAERNLEVFRVTTISLPSDQSLPIAPGLQITRDPVFGNYFQMRVEVEELERDRVRLQEILDEIDQGTVRIEALELVEAAASSSELRRILDELVDTRSELRALRDRYADDYPPIQDLLAEIQSIEGSAIPRVVGGIVSELARQERDLRSRVNSTQRELQEIPPRTIEEGRLERRVATTTELYNEIRGRVEAARLAAASSIPDVRILDPAVVPSRPLGDRRILYSAMILFGCLGAAMGGAIVLDRMDSRFRYAADVSRMMGLDILGSVPQIRSENGRKGVLNAAQALEAFRELRIHVGFAYGSAGPIVLAITSPSESEGKSFISSNLAVAFSEVGRRTLLIDGDTRRGDAHRLLGRERSPGLIDYLRERTGSDIIQATDHPNLDFIGSGARGVSTPELLASPRMAHFIGTVKRTYDVVIVDCPPLASGGDPLILGSLTGNLAIVIRTGTTEKGLAQAKLDQLTRLPIRILGVILNDVSERDSYHSYYVSYLPSYEPIPEEGDSQPTRLLSESTVEIEATDQAS